MSIVILCRTKADGQEALRRLHIIMERLGFNLHPSKTRLVNLKEGEEGFDFLGFHHRKVRSWRYRRYYLQRWPGRKAMKAVREKVRAIAGSRQRLQRSLKDVIDEVNPVLRGWGNYFAVGSSTMHFQMIDMYVLERLCLFLSKKHGKSGRGWGQRWRHINFRRERLHQLTGTVRCHKYPVHALG